MMNPTAMIMWALLGCIGFLLSGSYGAIVGVTIGLGISFMADLFG